MIATSWQHFALLTFYPEDTSLQSDVVQFAAKHSLIYLSSVSDLPVSVPRLLADHLLSRVALFFPANLTEICCRSTAMSFPYPFSVIYYRCF